MAMNLSIKTATYGAPENQEWLGSAHGTQSMDSITLNAADARTAFPTGLVPSGIKLRKNADGTHSPAVATDAVDGHLFTTIDLTAGGTVAVASAPNTPASLFWHGEVVTAKIPALAAGTASTATAPLVKYV